MENDRMLGLRSLVDWLSGWSRGGGFPDHQFGFDDVFVVKFGTGAVDAFQENLGGGASHFAQWLAHRGQARILEGSALDVVEAYDRNIVGHLAS